MKLFKFISVAFVLSYITFSQPLLAKKAYSADEYASKHNAKNIRMAMASKGFTWLSGSPADNEKLAIGKNAQFFGFVALRYESGRKVKRGALGSAFYQLATPEQREAVINGAQHTEEKLNSWWQTRKLVTNELEQHLYSGESFDQDKLYFLGQTFGLNNAEVALLEAQACALVEQSLTNAQKKQLSQLRRQPELANKVDKKWLREQLKSDENNSKLSKHAVKHTEAIFAKCFSYLTSSFTDRQVVPLGQPAQFFGFVSIRHKSGRGAKRGVIAKQFDSLLTSKQKRVLAKATKKLVPVVSEFMAIRTELMHEMDKIRIGSSEPFNLARYQMLAKQLGEIEIRCAIIEAAAYRQIRTMLSNKQQAQLMSLRGQYIIDKNKTEQLTTMQRGQQLYQLCIGCHANTGGFAPSLKGIVNKAIAAENYNYSTALTELKGKRWTEKNLQAFLLSPNKMAPGTSMEFTGLLNQQDREALIKYLAEFE